MTRRTRPLWIACLAAAAWAAVAGAAANETGISMPDNQNPFLAEIMLPFGLPPFDRIRDEHFLPAFAAGIAQQRHEIERIAADDALPTFANTLVALERSGRLLDQVTRVFNNLNAAHTNERLQEIQKTVAPQLAAHADAIFQHAALFARVRSLHETRHTLALDAESLRLLERYHADFVRAGAGLDAPSQARLREINAELAILTAAFGQNVLAETNALVVIVAAAAELDGLTPTEVTAAAAAAAARGLAGKYVLSLQNTTSQPLLKSLRNRALRERVYRAAIARGTRDNEHDNRPLILRIAALRAEQARLLGYGNHAAYVLADQTARTVDAVNDMLARLGPAAVANARREAADLQALIRAQGDDFTLAPWDWAFYAEQVRKSRYDIDDALLKPYFELENVRQNGVFYAANRLFGITFHERADLPVYHPDVRVWEVRDADGSPLGLFLGDDWARESKRGGAWMNQYVMQANLLGALPVVGNHLNVPKPPPGEPTLLTLDEVETMFHEFGHALHGLLSNVRYPRLAGTTVPRDFVEFPSQINEMWAFWPEVLANYARHHRTGEPLPQDLLDKVLAAQQFDQGFATSEYVAAAVLDQAWHQLALQAIPDDVAGFEAGVLADAGMAFAPVPPRYLSTYFSHVFAGKYAAGYYSYIWAEVLDADAVEWFKENGGLTRENGDRLREHVLSRGDSAEAMELYRRFTGREPSLEPLLLRRGLVDNPLGQR